MESAGGDRPREAPGEDELGTGRGLEGDDAFLWPDIEPKYRTLLGHVLLDSANVELGFHPGNDMESLNDAFRCLFVLKGSVLYHADTVNVRDMVGRRDWEV